MVNEDAILFFTGVGVIQIYLIGFYFLFSSNFKSKTSHLYLGLLFSAIAVRVSKTIYEVYLAGDSIILTNIGYATHSMIGPLLFIYFKNYRRRRPKFKFDILHLIHAIVLLILSPYLSNDTFWLSGGYVLLLIHSLLYLTPHLYLLIRNFDRLSVAEKKWFISIFSGVALLLAAFFTNYIMDWESNKLGPLAYGLIIYLMSLFVVIHWNFFKKSSQRTRWTIKDEHD